VFKICLAIPGKIININKNIATVNILGVKEKIHTGLVEAPQIGEYVLVHAGFAIEKIDEEYFCYLEDTIKIMLEE
jgi:hydrogenase assembly chaperone HypC/HupF